MKYRTTAPFLLSIVVCMGTGASAFAAGIPDTIRWVDDPGRPPYWISEETLRAEMDSRGRPIGSRLASVLHLFPGRSPSHELKMYADGGMHYKLSPDGALVECEPRSTSSFYDETAKDIRRLFELAAAGRPSTST